MSIFQKLFGDSSKRASSPRNISMEGIAAFSAKVFHQAAYGADEIRKVAEASSLASLVMPKSIQKDTNGLDFMQWFAVFSEFHNFYLHMTDRTAFTNLSAARRAELMNGVETWSINVAVETICAGMPKDKIRGIQEESLANLRRAHEEFGQYKCLLPTKPDESAGTLAWEFSKSVATYAGPAMDMVYITRAFQLATDGLIALDIKSFISECP